MFVKDMFFFHEHARKINIWSGFIIISPYLGPLLGAFITNTQIWQWAFGVYSIETGLCLIAIILFVDETYYDRKTVQPELYPNAPRWHRMLGIQQMRTKYIKNSFKDAVMRPLVIICKPVVFLSSLYYMLTFAWVVGINTTLSILLGPIYGFKDKQIGTLVSAIEVCNTDTDTYRLLLLHSHRRSHRRRNHRPLASRPDRQDLRPA